MASHFRMPTEGLSDDDLSRGFSFDARQANKQGQFSGPIPKSIVPGVQSASPPTPVLPLKSVSQRLTIPFPGLDFTSNTLKQIESPRVSAARDNDQVQDIANRNPSVSSHFSHGSDHAEPAPGDAMQPKDNARGVLDQPILTAIGSHSPPAPRCDKQIAAPSPTEVQDRPSCDVGNVSSNTIDSIMSNNDSRNGRRYFPRDYSRTPTSPPLCGDLEGFGIYESSHPIRTPPSHIRMIRRSQSRTRSFDVDNSASRRTHSRASNISRKRQADHHISEPDRKRVAMSQAVKHWNECMQITSEESDRARSTIQSLKKKLQRQAKDLQAAQDAMQKRDTSFRTLQKEYEHLQTKDSQVFEDKKDLEAKLNNLIVDYKKLQNHVKETTTKFSSCEGKLGSAINEQRELFNKSKNFFISLSNQMNQDEARGKANAEAVDRALQSSKQKRDELRTMVEHIQRDLHYQKSEYEHKIRSLEKENESQCDQIDAIEEDKERFYNEMVANRSTKACVDKVDYQLGSLVSQLRALDASQDTTAIELRNMKIKVDDLPGSHDFAEVKAQVSRSHDKLHGLEKLIQESLLPAIESIASKQSESQASVNSLAAAVQGGLTKLQEQIQTHAINLGQTIKGSHENHAEVIDMLALISAANEDVSSRVEVGNGRLESLVDGMSSHGTIGSSIAAILKSNQEYSENNNKIVSAQEGARDEAQRLHDVLVEQIDAKFLNHDAVSRKLITSLRENFDAGLATLRKRLSTSNLRQVNGNKPAFADSKMIQNVEAMRSNLQQVESKLSKIDDVSSSLQNMRDLSLLIQETSRYMDKEEQWLQQTLTDRALHSDGSGTTEKSANHTSSSQSSAASSTSPGYSSQDGINETICDNQIRKVVVHSPRPQDDSPLPVTTSQEQRRRRESARPRSILKQPHSKVVAPKILVTSSRNSFHSSEEVIADIRSTLVQSPTSAYPSWRRMIGLTPMTEYLRLNKAANSSRSGVVLGDLADVETATDQPGAAVKITATV